MGETSIITEYYNSYNEDGRMARHPLEYIRSKELISRYLTGNPMAILDIGGATGAFSFWLAENGYSVDLIDFTNKHIEIAKQKEAVSDIKLHSAIVGDARDLPYGDSIYDMVLLMGPLYHLINRRDRIKAYQEAYRVLKSKGIIICSYISRFASMIDGFFSGLVNDHEFLSIMKNDLTTGIHQNTTSNRAYFTDAYLHHPNEIPEEIAEAGFDNKNLFAIESFGNLVPDIEEKLNDDNYRETLLRTLRLVENDPTLFGISSHLLVVAIKEEYD